jgi:hypothetical protein
MSVLHYKSRPWIVFDPTIKIHRRWYAEFQRSCNNDPKTFDRVLCTERVFQMKEALDELDKVVRVWAKKSLQESK